MPSPKTKRQDGWATSLLGWAGAPFGWFGAKTANGTTLQPPGAATRGSGAIEGRNPYDYVLPGYAGFNGDPSGFCGIPGMGGIRWPGTYSTYRIMMSHPTVALSRASVHAPVLAGSWFYESHAEDENEDACELVQKIMEKSRQRWLTDALRSLDFGFQAFEMTFDRDDEGYAIPTLKPLLPELTTIEVDANGNVSGIRNGDATLKPGEFVLINYDVEGSNYYGRSRLENIRRVWANYLAIEDQGYLLDKKAAGTVPIVLYPSDTSVPTTSDPNATGDGKSNLAVAQSIVQALQNHRGVAIENFAGMAPDTPEQAAVLAGKADYVIDIKDFGNTGPSQSAILEKLRYYDQMLVRGYLRSERTVIEANTAGSRADSESHTASISDTDTDLIHAMIVEQFNRQVVDEMLAQNFGESARGTVWISPREVVDERRATMNLLLQAALADPMLRGELFERIDKDSLFQWAGIKLMEDARPWDDMPTVDEQKDQSIEHAAKMAEATGGEKAGQNLSRETIMLSMEDSSGHWVTIGGAHVFIGDDGKISKGPSHMVGKTVSDIGGKADPDIESLVKHSQSGGISNTKINKSYGPEVQKKVKAEVSRLQTERAVAQAKANPRPDPLETLPEVKTDNPDLAPHIEASKALYSDDLNTESTAHDIENWKKKVLSNARASLQREEDESDRIASEKHAEAEDFAKWKSIRDAMNRDQSLAEKTLGVMFSKAEGGSRYADYKGLKLRIADHEQVAGGGFNSTTGERMGESDVSWVVTHESEPLKASDIRKEVAKALKKFR